MARDECPPHASGPGYFLFLSNSLVQPSSYDGLVDSGVFARYIAPPTNLSDGDPRDGDLRIGRIQFGSDSSSEQEGGRQ